VPPPPNLPAALLRHAELGCEEPWLFQAEGWDWRWHSWGEIARRVLERAEGLTGRPPGSRLSFIYVPRPEDVVLDLAIQTAGLVSAPVGSSPPDPLSHRPPPNRERGNLAGGAVVVRNGEVVEVTAAELVEMAERVQGEIQASGGREIVVLSGPLEDPVERAMLAWATVAGAAVVLEPNPAYRVATAAWVRPTVFHGTREEIAGLRQWVEKERRGFWRHDPRLPFRRLRTVLVTGRHEILPEEMNFWGDRGVLVRRLPSI
jgi:hypothetical protein